MKPLHVDLVSEHASPLAALGGDDSGGQNVYVAALANQLAELGCKVTVHTRRDDETLPDRVQLGPQVTVEHVTAGPPMPIPKDDLFGYMPIFAAQLRQRWLADPPDIVHAQFWMSGWAAANASARIPLVQTFHALGVVKARYQGAADTSPPERQAVETALLARADRIIATCQDEVDELLALGAYADRVAVVPCGIDPKLFHPARSTAPRPHTRPRIVVVGRLVRRKGVEDVVRALPRLPGVELVVVGGPPRRNLDADPEVRRLRSIADDCGVAEQVQFVGGVAREAIPPLLREADVVVSVPWYEPFGIVPLEAMACGVPVVGSAVGGLLDTVRHERTGILVPPRDPEAIATAVGRLLANPSLRQRMGEEATALVREQFTWSQVAWSTLETYRDLLGIPARWMLSA